MLAALRGRASDVAAVGAHFPLTAVGFQLAIQYGAKLLAQLRIFNRDQHFNPAFEITRHRIGRADQILLVAARRVDSFFRHLDSEIRDATENEVDLKFILPFGVAVLGLVALRYSSTTPLWLTLLIFAFNSFLGLHAPTPAELGIMELEG